MIPFFKSASPTPNQPKSSVDGVKPDDITPDSTVASTPSQDAPVPPAYPTDQAEPRLSGASVPTIDSANTIQGSPADAPRSRSPQPHAIPLPSSPNPTASLSPPSPVNIKGSASLITVQSSSHTDQHMQTQSQSALPYSSQGMNASVKDPRSFSFPSFTFLRSDAKQKKSRPPPLHTQSTSASKSSEKKTKSRGLFVLSAASSEKRAKESAMIVRSVIVGNHDAPDATSKKQKSVSKSELARVKSQLLAPKTAANVISQLRTLPPHPDAAVSNPSVPIRAVCLDTPDRDVHQQHFAQLQSVATASLSTVSAVLSDVHLIDLLAAPNMGFGAPVTAQGLFAGAVPTAETVVEGIEQITPQLMALGYATGKAILPDHKGVIVPVDRISAITYWWGFEICLPPPTIAFLESTESPGSSLLNLLTALSVLNEGVREVLPFIRYISQFIQSEWSMVKRADQGKGVVCTATWLLPVALVPHPWDFPDLPPPHTELAIAGQSTSTSPSVNRFSATLTTPKPSTEVPHAVPRTSSAYSTETGDEGESRPVISSQPPVLPELVVSSPGSIDGAPPKNIDGEPLNAHDKAQHDGDAIAH